MAFRLILSIKLNHYEEHSIANRFLQNSLDAINYALSFFEGTETNFFIINIQKTSDYTTSELMTTSSTKSVYSGVLDDNKKALEELKYNLEKKCASTSFSFQALLDFDVFTDAINQAVAANNIDLIIMGTNGATGAREVLFGRNTLKVIRQVDCPLITVPEGYIYKKIDAVLFSMRNHNNITKSGLKPLMDILSRHPSKLNILAIQEKEIKEEEIDVQGPLIDILQGFDPIYHQIYKIPIAMAISAFEQLNPIDLHALFATKESFIKRFVFGSKINYVSKVPLLILHL